MNAETPTPVSLVGNPAELSGVLDQVPAMVWVTAPDGRLIYLNQAWRHFTGQRESEALGAGWLEVTHSDDRAEARRVYLAARTARAPFELECRLRAASGEYRWVLGAGNPRFSEDGAFRGYVGSVVDVHERRETEDRFRALTNSVPAFVWFASQDGALHYLNDRWYEYSGQTAEEALPNGWADMLHPDDFDAVLSAWAETRARGEGYAMECRFRRHDGAFRWYMVRADPMRTTTGGPLAWVGTSIDIHDLKLAEQRQALLINELNHRVKNTLATVQGLASQLLKAAPSPERFREGFEERLVSLARAHDLLTDSSWGGARLSEIVDRAVAPWRGARIVVEGPEVWLEARQALSISMALHELATNAAKHGALSGAAGDVLIAWRRHGGEAGEVVELRWKERGGPPVARPQRRGFGTQLLERGLERELQGTVALDFAPDGVECRITFPLRPPPRDSGAKEGPSDRRTRAKPESSRAFAHGRGGTTGETSGRAS